MSIRDLLQTELASLPTGSAFSAPRSIAVTDAGLQFTCELNELDSLACEFNKLSLAAPSLAKADLKRLQEISAALSAKISYLLEAIGPIEHDQEQCVVQMRSNPPHKDDDGSSYYELLVRRQGLSLHRYRKQPGAPRQSIPAAVTREVLLRLAGDFAAAVA